VTVCSRALPEAANPQQLTSAEQICWYMRRLYGRGMTTTSGGNISIREEKDLVWISPTGTDKGVLEPHQVALTNLQGDMHNDCTPSSEAPFHLEIYRRHRGIRSVLHAHPVGLVALSVNRRTPNVMILPSVYRVCSDVAFVPYALPGSTDLADKIVSAISGNRIAAILENHGAVVAGENIGRCFTIFETIETAAKIMLKAAQLGNIHYLSTDELELIPTGAPAINGGETRHRISDAERSLRIKMTGLVIRAYEQSFFVSSMGSISCRFGDGFLLTPHGVDRALVVPSDLVYFENSVQYGDRPASRSFALHAAIYEMNPRIKSVIVAQPPNVMAFAVTGHRMNTKSTPESYVLLREIELLPFGAQYSDPPAVAAHISNDTPLVIIQNDCIISTGGSLLEAFDRLEVAEFNARFELSSIPFGGMKGLSKSQQMELRKRYFS